MEQFCLALAVHPGKIDAARVFGAELAGPRGEEHAAFQRRMGIAKESWYLQHTSQGDLLLLYLESHDLPSTRQAVRRQHGPHERWLQARLVEVAGIDLHDALNLAGSEQLFRGETPPDHVPV